MKNIRLALFISTLCGITLLCGCSKPGPGDAGAAGVDHYTCTMHPSVRSKAPGTCPICGMDLVPVMKPAGDAGTAEGGAAPAERTPGADWPREFTIPPDRQQLFGVTYATATVRPLRRTVRAVGLVAATAAGHWDYVARVDGYVHTLHVFAPGDPVKKGQVLMDLYSPDLAATENEYLDLLGMREQGRRNQNPAAIGDADRLLAGARARLEQWNIPGPQIDALERAGKASEYLPLESPVAGIVEDVGVHQGRHVAVGDHLVDLVDLSSVWVWAEFYENELPMLKPGLSVTVTSAALPGFALPCKIAVVDPFIDPVKRTARARVDVDNADMRLRPGAYVDVTLSLEGGTGLTVPFGAVLPTGQHNIVFVDMGSGRLQPRFVQLGGKFGDDYQVTAGIRAGERVVSSANFLVDAEARVQGAVRDF
ncbi:MAG TPA: efflux RND transporter periplasmic adaptor subunit [Opitutaceae bacterium]|jgi:Cu(I)/Ag(I) efflux system membrane fusion protein